MSFSTVKKYVKPYNFVEKIWLAAAVLTAPVYYWAFFDTGRSTVGGLILAAFPAPYMPVVVTVVFLLTAIINLTILYVAIRAVTFVIRKTVRWNKAFTVIQVILILGTLALGWLPLYSPDGSLSSFRRGYDLNIFETYSGLYRQAKGEKKPFCKRVQQPTGGTTYRCEIKNGQPDVGVIE